MEWVAIDVHIAGDAITHRLAEAFRLRVPEAAGLLALAFAGMAQHAQDGELADVTDSQLEAWAMWHGKRGAFAAFFRAQLCDEAGCVRAWEKYNGRNIRRAEAAKLRTQQWRAERDAVRSERTPNANGNAPRTHNSTHNVRRTGHDRTEQNLKAKSKERGASAPAWAVALRERWVARVGEIAPSSVAKQLATAHGLYGEDRLLAAIDEYAERKLAAGKDRKLEWFAADVGQWVERAAATAQPLVDADGILTERGVAVLNGAHS